MLELIFGRRPDGGLGVRFEGLDGCERVTSVKQALELLQVENPAIAFCRNVEAGVYNRLSDQEYQALLASVEAVSMLWRYDGDEPAGESTQDRMNPLMLLANALGLIGRQGAQAGPRAGKD